MLALLGLLTHSVVISQGSWSDTANTCALPDSAPTLLSVLSATLAVDVLLLLLMLYGLFRKRDTRRFSLGGLFVETELVVADARYCDRAADGCEFHDFSLLSV
jgi:hypothetical protein